MSLARRHRERILAAQTAASAPTSGAVHVPAAETLPAAGATNASPADRAAAQIALRLSHDLRRLKEIKAIGLKVEAKRQMLPEYKDWVDGLLAADAGVGTGVAAEVLPIYMVWLIDVGGYAAALDLVPFMFKHKVAMPARYNRDVATIVVEEIADAALKVQASDETFPLEIIYRVAELTENLDMHDQARAKLLKAMGTEELREAEGMEAAPAARTHLTIARNTLRASQGLNDRIGVKDKIKRAEKLIAANLAAFPPAPDDENAGTPAAQDETEQGGDTAA